MRKRLDAPENRREIARQPSAKNQPRRAKCPAATNATVSGARIFRDNWEVRKNDADTATVRGDEPATATVDAVHGKARAKEIRDGLGNPKKVLLGVDRLDYTKGIRHRLKAYEELLADGKVTVEDAALNLGANSFRSFKDVIIPLLKAHFMSSFVLSFLRSVTCLSVVIFLYAPSTTVGTISVMVLVQSGQYGEAAAFTIVLITIAFTVLKLAQWVLGKQGIELEL